MRRAGNAKATESAPSTLLTPQENEQLEELLGRKRVSLATAVVQLLMALPHSPGSWSLQHTGVACFVKDNPLRSYFIRLFDLKNGRLIWEQELYNQLIYSRAQPFFHTFAADDCQVGMNFANEREAAIFFTIVDDKINQRSHRQGKRQVTAVSFRDHRELPPLPSSNCTDPRSVPQATVSIRTLSIKDSAVSDKGKKEKRSKSKKKSPKFSKADIGAPSGFTHVKHVGMDPSNLDPDLKKLLSRAGISEAQLTDEETSRLIYDVINQSGGMEAVKMALNTPGRQSPLPPLPFDPAISGTALPPSRGRSGPLPPIPGAPQQGSFSRGPPAPPERVSLPAPPHSGRSGPLPPLPGASLSPLPPGRRGGNVTSPASASFPPAPPSGRTGSLPPPPHASRPPLPAGGRSTAPPSASLPPPPPNRSNRSFPQPPSASDFPPPHSSWSMAPSPPPPASYPPPPSVGYREQMPPPPPPSVAAPSPPSGSYGDSLRRPTPPPNHVRSTSPAPPPVPPDPSRGGTAPAPPPPPPPCFSDPPRPPPGGQGPPILASPEASSGGGSRDALLDQIRLGKKLKSVDNKAELPPPPVGLDAGEGIVGALMMAMQKRSKVIHSSDEADEFDDEDDDDEWDG